MEVSEPGSCSLDSSTFTASLGIRERHSRLSSFCPIRFFSPPTRPLNKQHISAEPAKPSQAKRFILIYPWGFTVYILKWQIPLKRHIYRGRNERNTKSCVISCCMVSLHAHCTISALGKIKWEKHYNSPGTLLPKFCDYILSALCHRYHKLIKSFHAWPLLTMLSEKRGLLITTHFWQLPRGNAAFCSSEMTPQLTYWMLNIDSYYECCQTQSAGLQIRGGRSSGRALANVRSGIKGLLDSLGMRFIDSIKRETDQVLVMMEMVVAEWGWAYSDVDLRTDAAHKWPLKKMLKVGVSGTRTTAALG